MSSRRDEKERRRQERLAAERAEGGGGTRRILGLAVAAGLVAAAVLAIVLVSSSGDGGGGSGGGLEVDDREGSKPPVVRDASLRRTAAAAGCEVSHPRDEGRDHLTRTKEAKYRTKPPTSGAHDPIPTEDGAYREAPPTRNFVHSLEHGRILMLYKPDLAERRQLALKGLYDEDPSHMLLFSYEDMPYEVAAVAWTRLLSCERWSPKVFDAIRAFKDAHRDQGPEFVP